MTQNTGLLKMKSKYKNIRPKNIQLKNRVKPYIKKTKKEQMEEISRKIKRLDNKYNYINLNRKVKELSGNTRKKNTSGQKNIQINFRSCIQKE